MTVLAIAHAKVTIMENVDHFVIWTVMACVAAFAEPTMGIANPIRRLVRDREKWLPMGVVVIRRLRLLATNTTRLMHVTVPHQVLKGRPGVPGRKFLILCSSLNK